MWLTGLLAQPWDTHLRETTPPCKWSKGKCVCENTSHLCDLIVIPIALMFLFRVILLAYMRGSQSARMAVKIGGAGNTSPVPVRSCTPPLHGVELPRPC